MRNDSFGGEKRTNNVRGVEANVMRILFLRDESFGGKKKPIMFGANVTHILFLRNESFGEKREPIMLQ